jgi:hypothetical protein
MNTALPEPPDDWPYVGTVITNLDHSVNKGLAELLSRGGCFGAHAALDHHGLVWYADGRWHERVSVYKVPRAVYSAETLEELAKTVNDEYGWA